MLHLDLCIVLMLRSTDVFIHHCCSVDKLCLTLCNPMDCSLPDSSDLHYLLEYAQIHVHSVGDAIQPSHPLPPSSLFAFSFPRIRVFSNELALHIRWLKYQSFSFSISPSNEYSGLIFFFRIDWFDLLAIQGTLKSLLQHHNSKASILQHSVFFMVQLSHWYMTTGKNHSFNQMDFCWKSDIFAF